MYTLKYIRFILYIEYTNFLKLRGKSAVLEDNEGNEVSYIIFSKQGFA